MIAKATAHGVFISVGTVRDLPLSVGDASALALTLLDAVNEARAMRAEARVGSVTFPRKDPAPCAPDSV